MEFNFESRSSRTNRFNKETAPEAPAENMASDRLKKAIERNRAKQQAQMERDSRTQEAAPQRPRTSTNDFFAKEATQATFNHEQQDLFNRENTKDRASFFNRSQETQNRNQQEEILRREYEKQEQEREKLRAEQFANRQKEFEARRESLSRRQKMEETTNSRVQEAQSAPKFKQEFKEEIKLPVKRKIEQSEEAVTEIKKKTRLKSPEYVRELSEKEKKMAAMAIKAGWVFCLFMILRLVFADRGIISYYSKQGKLAELNLEKESIQKDNEETLQEIKNIKSKVALQKQLVRDNLGYIAKDEYLIMFPKEVLPD